MMEFQAARPGANAPAQPNYTLMQMQAAPGGMYSTLQQSHKKKRSPLKVLLMLVFLLLALAVVAATVLIATGTIALA
jgi:hypothetical protein